jgi:hypothetical protein
LWPAIPCGRPQQLPARAGQYLSLEYPASIDLPKGIDPDMLRLGMVGTVTVISDKAGPIGLLATIFLWVKAYAAYQ